MEKLWCFWANLDNLTENRIKSLNCLIEHSGVDVKLLSAKTAYDYQIQNNPIHEGFYYLSDTDKGDYIRAYLAYHYGGGYTDIKPFKMNWAPYFDFLNLSNYDLVGPAEPMPGHVAYHPAAESYNNLVHVNKYVIKKNCNIAKQWLEKVNLLLDENLSELKKNPGWYHPRAVNKLADKTGVHQPDGPLIFPGNYPMFWNYSGKIFHQIQYENLDKVSTIMQQEYFNANVYR